MIVTKRDYVRNTANRVRVRKKSMGLHAPERGVKARGFFAHGERGMGTMPVAL